MQRWLPPLFSDGENAAALWNSLVALQGHRIPLNEEGTFVVIALIDPPSPDSWVARLEIPDWEASVALMVQEFPFRALVDVELEASAIASLPSALREAMVEGMVSTLVTLPGLPELPPSLMTGQGPVGDFPEFARDTIQWFDVQLENASGIRVTAIAAIDRSGLGRLIGERLPRALPLNGGLARSIAVPVSISLGSISLSFDELRAIEPGAVAVMAERPEHSVLLRTGNLVFDFNRIETGWVCTQVSQSGSDGHAPSTQRDERPHMDDQLPAPVDGTDAASVSVSDLRITLDFDIGRISVPLEALAQWQNGSVVDLDLPPDAEGVEVSIRAGNDVVGKGDLVRIDNRVAVRITRLMLRR